MPRDDRQDQQPVAVDRVELVGPVVVSLEARNAQVDVGHGDALRRSVDDVGVDAVTVHVLEALRSDARTEAVVVPADQALGLAPTRPEGRPLDLPHRSVVAVDHLRCAVAELRRQARGEEVDG